MRTLMKLVVLALWTVAGLSIGILVGSALASLLGCGSAPAAAEGAKVESPKVFITVRNTTDHDLFATVRGGLMGRSITVAANSESSFWGYRSMLPDRIEFIVLPKAPEVRRK